MSSFQIRSCIKTSSQHQTSDSAEKKQSVNKLVKTEIFAPTKNGFERKTFRELHLIRRQKKERKV